MRLTTLGANRMLLDMGNGTTVLFSYLTPVACHITGRGYYRTDKSRSPATSRHIWQWLNSERVRDCTTKPQAFFDGLVAPTTTTVAK